MALSWYSRKNDLVNELTFGGDLDFAQDGGEYSSNDVYFALLCFCLLIPSNENCKNTAVGTQQQTAKPRCNSQNTALNKEKGR